MFEAAAGAQRRIVFAEGEDERVLRAAHAMLQETVDAPILIGRPDVIAARVERVGLTIDAEHAFEIVNPEDDPRYRDYWTTYHGMMERQRCYARPGPRDHAHQYYGHRGRHGASRAMRIRLICGTFGQFRWHLNYITQMLGTGGLHPIGALSR